MNVSTISDHEYATMNATWLTMTEPTFQCDAIEHGYRKRKDAEVVINYRRLENGCGVISKTPKVEIDGVSYYSCLCHENFKDYSLPDTIFLYKQFKTGNLAHSGGLMDQSSRYIEAMKFMDRLHAEHENKTKVENG